jgi:hypothetical protein
LLYATAISRAVRFFKSLGQDEFTVFNLNYDHGIKSEAVVVFWGQIIDA